MEPYDLTSWTFLFAVVLLGSGPFANQVVKHFNHPPETPKVVCQQDFISEIPQKDYQNGMRVRYERESNGCVSKIIVYREGAKK